MRWRDVPGYEGQYEVSDTGLIRNWSTWHVLQPRLCRKDGSYLVNLSGGPRGQKTFAVHRIVADVYVPNPYNLNVVKFSDGDKTNITPENLYWTHVKGPERRDTLAVWNEDDTLIKM